MHSSTQVTISTAGTPALRPGHQTCLNATLTVVGAAQRPGAENGVTDTMLGDTPATAKQLDSAAFRLTSTPMDGQAMCRVLLGYAAG